MLIESYSLTEKYFKPIETAFGKVLDYLKQPLNIQIEVELIDIDEMREVNLVQRGINKPTDVLSFPMLNLKPGDKADAAATDLDYDGTGENIALGSVLICLDIIKQNALDYGRSVDGELVLMFVHSALHLFGFDHKTPAEEALMKKAERAVLKL